jgi:hypothetical protein
MKHDIPLPGTPHKNATCICGHKFSEHELLGGCSNTAEVKDSKTGYFELVKCKCEKFTLRHKQRGAAMSRIKNSADGIVSQEPDLAPVINFKVPPKSAQVITQESGQR